MEVRYQNELVGLNNRMTEISAAIGIEQLKRLPSWTSKRIENAAILEKLIPENRLQLVPEGYRHVYHQFTMRVPAELRPKVLETLRNLGVGCDVYYPTPVSQLASFKDTTYLPESALAASEVVSIPVRQSLSNRELKRVEEAVEFVFATIIKD
jgi:dTDP-4-amino-4,6-dideoxygalactose transaminase